MTKLITTDLKNKDDPEWVKELNAFLEANITKKVRNLAKAANFGLPGRMGPARFYVHLRSNGLEATPEEAEHMCQAWIEAFPEMKLHRNPERATDTSHLYKEMFGRRTDEDYEEDDEDGEYEDTGKDDSFAFRAVLPCGQIRNRCSINAACNAQFQGTTAVGVKLAGWNLVKYGYGERLVDMIHDEYLYCLYPDEIRQHVPIIERLMVDGMKQVIPDVKVNVETTCMLHWDKEALEFSKLQWNPDGTPILEEPPYVQNLLTHKE